MNDPIIHLRTLNIASPLRWFVSCHGRLANIILSLIQSEYVILIDDFFKAIWFWLQELRRQLDEPRSKLTIVHLIVTVGITIQMDGYDRNFNSFKWNCSKNLKLQENRINAIEIIPMLQVNGIRANFDNYLDFLALTTQTKNIDFRSVHS